MTRIVPIVEGHGEVSALPILIKRIADVVAPGVVVDVSKPIRVPRHRLVKPGELERVVELAARVAGSGGQILVLLDADEDCPKELASELLVRARRARSDRSIHVIIAKTEFETWFVAAAASIAGRREIRMDIESPAEPEAIRDPKAWLSDRMPTERRYRATLDQPALTAVFDLQEAKRSRSFMKMWSSVSRCLRQGDEVTQV